MKISALGLKLETESDNVVVPLGYEDDSMDDPCPECGMQLRAEWSGVECPNPNCDYWFCF